MAEQSTTQAEQSAPQAEEKVNQPEEPTTPTEQPSPQAGPPAADQADTGELDEQTNGGRSWFFWPVVGLAVITGVFLVVLVIGLVIAIFVDPGNAGTWVGIIRDLFIIVLAMEGMFMGIALIVLILQLAALVNVLQNEISPIVDNVTETTSTVRGTAQFMSENLVEPVIKFGALTAGIGGVVRELFGIRRTLRSASRDAKQIKE
jgi:hypothetical protein